MSVYQTNKKCKACRKLLYYASSFPASVCLEENCKNYCNPDSYAPLESNSSWNFYLDIVRFDRNKKTYTKNDMTEAYILKAKIEKIEKKKQKYRIKKITGWDIRKYPIWGFFPDAVYQTEKRFLWWWIKAPFWTIYENRAYEYCEALNNGTITEKKLAYLLRKNPKELTADFD